jgi:S-adenosylmethionine hydrolase
MSVSPVHKTLPFHKPLPGGLITLTTDFGIADHFVGTMKGVIYSIAPRVRIVDISHQITPFAVAEAALMIAQSWPYFPKGSIHVAVVDPGVGSTRRPILVEAGGHYFVGPDNGLFSLIFEAAKFKAREISNPALRLPEVSRTFHGRDIFAPAAAHLANKVPPARFGKPVTDPLHAPGFQPTRLRDSIWRGVVLRTDRFGNMVTNFHIHQFPDIKTEPMELRIGEARIHRLALNYSDVEAGQVFAIVGSSGFIEISANQASAAEKLRCGAGAPVELQID